MKKMLFSFMHDLRIKPCVACCLLSLLLTLDINAQEITEHSENAEDKMVKKADHNSYVQPLTDQSVYNSNHQQIAGTAYAYKELIRNSKTTKPLPQTTFTINPLGMLQFGPIVQSEFAVSEKGHYLVPSIRVPYLGLLYHLIVIGGEDDVTVSPVALGIGLGYKKLFPKSNGAWYVGGFMEYSFGSSSGDSFNRFESSFVYLNLMANAGYRWRNPESKFVLSVGAYLGPSIALKDESMEQGRIVDERATTVFGMAELTLGWEFSKKTN